MTVEEFLALPDDGKERYLIRGRLRPREPVSALRGPRHARTHATMANVLGNWLDAQPAPRGWIVSGQAGFRLDRGTMVGVDVAYVSAALADSDDEEQPFFGGPPVLAVEILSPSDKHEAVVEKIGEYLRAGVMVWEIDPDFRTVRVHRPGRVPETFNTLQVLVAEPELPGFRVAVARVFEIS
jgi:Uma2 family endonuclease